MGLLYNVLVLVYWSRTLRVSMYVRVFVCLFVYVRVCMCVFVSTPVFVCLCLCKYVVCLFKCVFEFSLCVCVGGGVRGFEH